MQKVSTLRLVFFLSFLSFYSVLFSGCSTARNAVFRAPRPVVNTIGFNKPLTTKYRISQKFKPSHNKKHMGIDLAGAKGSPIFSVKKGRVIYQGMRFSGYGKMIMIKHANGITSLYSHLEKIFVRAGQIVSGGHLIGTMGRTGRATGVHLHFELMQHKEPIDPEKIIQF